MKDNDAHENGDSDGDGCYYDGLILGMMLIMTVITIVNYINWCLW
jgi:hypothetical protein